MSSNSDQDRRTRRLQLLHSVVVMSEAMTASNTADTTTLQTMRQTKEHAENKILRKKCGQQDTSGGRWRQKH